MFQVRHRLASGSLHECWEFDPARCTLDVVFRQGSAEPVGFAISLCAPDRPRIGAHPIMRLDGESWRVLPAVFRAEGGMLIPVDAAVHESLGQGTQLILTHAPADVDAELGAL